MLSPLICNPAADDVDTKLVFAFVTVASLGVPISKQMPSATVVNLPSKYQLVKAELNVRVEPETVNEEPALLIHRSN